MTIRAVEEKSGRIALLYHNRTLAYLTKAEGESLANQLRAFSVQVATPPATPAKPEPPQEEKQAD